MTRASKPSIGLDGFNLALEEGTGIATYARNLSATLQEIGAEVDIFYGLDRERNRSALMNEVRFFDVGPGKPEIRPARYLRLATSALGLRPMPVTPISVGKHVVIRDFAHRMPSFDRIWNVRDLQRVADLRFQLWGAITVVRVPHPPEVMHWTYPTPLRMANTRNVYTLHDLVPLRLPHTTLDTKNAYHRLVRKIARRADHLVTVSEHAKTDIVELLGVDPKRVTNTYQASALPKALMDRSEAQVRGEVERALGLPFKGYFLFYGAIEPKKNIGRLIQAHLASGVEAPLVIVGRRAWLYERELRFMPMAERSSGAEFQLDVDRRRIIRFDYAPLSFLMSLIRGAKALVFPSLYEGFGLPVLEAMQLGTPVITGDVASLPEVAGGAALYVNPYDVGELAEALRRVESDGPLRAHLSAAGLQQSRRFTQAAYRERLLALYRGLGVKI